MKHPPLIRLLIRATCLAALGARSTAANEIKG
jgi:hypothetical protein